MAVTAPIASASPKIVSREAAAIATVVITALVLRIINLDAGLWYDEVLTLTQSVRLPPDELLVSYGSLNNHVLYTWLAKGSVAIFGEHPWSLRAPALVFGVLSIAAAWAMFRETGYRWAAVATAALLAVSYHHVWFSQNARGYTGLLLFTTLSGLALHRALTTGVRRYWFAYAAAFAAALLVHLSAAFLLMAQGVAVLLHGALVARKQTDFSPSRWLTGPVIAFGLGSAIVIVAFAPMIGGMIDAFSSVAGPAEPQSPGVVEWKNPVWTALETLRSFGAVGFLLPVAAIFAALGAWRMTLSAPWIAAPYAIHIPLTFAILSALSMRIWPRYFFIDIAFLIAAVVIGAYWFADFVALRAKTGERLGMSSLALKIAGTAIMIGASIPLLVRNYTSPKQDFESAIALIEQERDPEDTIATMGLASAYYRGYRGLGWPELTGPDDLKEEDGKAGRLWVVTAFPAHTRAHFYEEQLILDTEFEIADEFDGTLSGGKITVYRSREP